MGRGSASPPLPNSAPWPLFASLHNRSAKCINGLLTSRNDHLICAIGRHRCPISRSPCSIKSLPVPIKQNQPPIRTASVAGRRLPVRISPARCPIGHDRVPINHESPAIKSHLGAIESASPPFSPLKCINGIRQGPAGARRGLSGASQTWDDDFCRCSLGFMGNWNSNPERTCTRDPRGLRGGAYTHRQVIDFRTW